MNTIVITGSSRGVGYSTCQTFLNKGWRVIGISRTEGESKNLLKFKDFHFYSVDLCNPQSVRKSFLKIYKDHKKIDVLINSAAIFESIRFLDQSFDKIDKIIDTNLKGVIYSTRCVIEGMISQKSGKIINVSSVSGCHGIENQAVYSSTKHALTGFADSLNQEVIRHGVQVVTICPGGIDTPLWNKRNPYHGDKSRLLTPEDISSLISFIVDQPDRVVFKSIVLYPDNEIH
jgi:hypothetical protein